MSGKLTAKQEMFCREYLIDLNATQAAIRAGYSKNTASETGYENLRKPQLAEHIAKLKAHRSETVKIDSDYVLRRLSEIDQLDILDILNDDLSDFKPVSEWPKSWRISITAFDISVLASRGQDNIETTVKKIKWPDKTRNLELIGKHVDVRAFEGDGSNDKGESLNITFGVSDAVKDVRVTRGGA